MSITLHRLRPAEFSMYAPQLVELYISAMGYEPDILNNRVAAWRQESIRPGFTAIIAENHSRITGVAYGFLGSPDTWWDRQLRLALLAQGEISDGQWDMLHNYFELAEIHVHPRFQGQGIGAALLKELCWNIPAKYVLLSTPEVDQEANAAFRLYRSYSFFDVLRNVRYPTDPRSFAILGAHLPLNQRVQH